MLTVLPFPLFLRLSRHAQACEQRTLRRSTSAFCDGVRCILYPEILSLAKNVERDEEQDDPEMTLKGRRKMWWLRLLTDNESLRLLATGTSDLLRCVRLQDRAFHMDVRT